MKNTRTLLLYFLWFLISSCASINDLTFNQDKTSITENNVKIIEGTYLNYSFDTVTGRQQCLWEKFYLYGKWQDNWKNQQVVITVINNNKLKATLKEGEKILLEKTIKGKIKDGDFITRRKFFVIPFFPLILDVENKQMKLGIEKNKLVVAYLWNSTGEVLLYGATRKEKGIVSYNKLK